MLRALFCKSCGAALSRPLALLSLKDPSVPPPRIRNRLPLSPAGEAYKSYEPMERSYRDEPAPLEFTPQYWLNPADLTAAVAPTPDERRRGGCCGEAGSDGPNRLCRCKAEVGTFRDDCWTPTVFIPEPGGTEWRDIF